MWASDHNSIAFVGTHKPWENFTPKIYLTYVSNPGSLVVVSGPATGAYDRPAWEGSESIFFFDFDAFPVSKAFRYDVKTGKPNGLTGISGIVGDQYAVGARFLYTGTNKGLKAIEWHLVNTVHDIGSGFNPDP